MLIRTEFNVIHWEFNIPTDLLRAPFSNSILRYSLLRVGNAGQVVGIRFRWTLRLRTDKEQLMSYIAEDDYYFSNLQNITRVDIEVILKASHSNYSDEFNRRKVPPQALDFTKIYYPLTIDPEAMYWEIQSAQIP
jgi:hypothetical protein